MGFFRNLLDSFETMHALEAQRIKDANERRVQEQCDWVDRAIIRRQLPVALEKLPAWQNVCHESVTIEETDMYGSFVYRVAKRDIEKHMSIAVCVEITDVLNSILRQIRFDAYELVNFAYQEAVYHVQSALSVLSVRADWDSPSVQAEIQAQRSNAFSKYSLSYRAHAPFLVLLQVTGIEDAGNYLMLSVKIADDTEYYRWQPQALPFC